MNKNNRNKLNIIFSSFLVIGYIVCTYFFSSLASQVSGVVGTLIYVLITVVFGLLLFYATRVGEGKQVRRFSLAVLLMVDIPSCLIILAGLIKGFPLHDALAPAGAVPSLVMLLACVALGYGIPYTFLSGYELREEEDVEEEIEKTEKVLEGGLAEELAETQAQDEANTAETADEAPADEIPEAPAAEAEEATEAETETPDAE